jgi:methylmalonyl-CoA mutase
MMEALTQELYDGALKLVEEIDAQGGMVSYIESGAAKLKIEEAATRKQVRP